VTGSNGAPVTVNPSSSTVTANAGPDFTSNEGATSQFRGTASGNGNLSYSWTFGDGATSTGTLTPSHAYTNHGIYTATLIVKSTNGKTASDSTVVTVTDLPPTVTMGGPYSGLAATPVSFSASATSPSPVDQAAGFTYLWNFGDGSTSYGASPSHAYALDGIYTVTVTATDVDGAQAQATSVARVYPSVNAGLDPTVNEGETVNFVGTAVGSSSLTYHWDFGDGGTADGTLTPSHVYNEWGAYTATLTVTDTVFGFSSSSAIPMIVTDVAPTVSIGGPSAATVQAPVSFSASATSPSPVDQAAGFTYLWNFGDGTTGSGASPSHTYAVDGIDTVTVTATDVDGAQSQASMVVDVFPSVSAGSDVSTDEGGAVNFQGSAIGGALTYLWNFGDGGTAAGTLTPSHVYNQVGTFTATLTATDSVGLSNRSSLQVTVIDVPPSVNIGGPYSGIAGLPVSFLASAAEPASPQPSFTYGWDFGDGSSGAGSSPTHTYAQSGDYTVTLTVTDPYGGSTVATTDVPVTPVSAASSLTVSGFPTPDTAGTVHSITVTALLPNGNIATGYLGTIQFTSSDAQAVLPVNYTFVPADGGTHTFSVTMNTAATQSITATDTSTPSITGSETGVAVGAAAASSLMVSGFLTPDTAGAAQNVTITALDAYGNVASGYTGTVQFTSSDSQAILPANYTFVADDAGSHTFSVRLTTAANQNITATDTSNPTITGGETGISVGAASGSSLTVTGFPTPDTAGVSHHVTVTAYDPYGNVATGYTGTVQFTSTDRQAILPANYTFVAADAGIHVFFATLKTMGLRSISATDTAISSVTGTESGISVGAAAASSLTVTGFPTPDTTGTAHNVSLTAFDAYDNVASGYTGTVHFTSTDSQATLPANYTFVAADAGMHTFSVTLKTVGTQSITATDAVTSSITGDETGIVVQSGTAQTLGVTGFPTPDSAGAAHNVTITAYNASGGVATGYSGTVHFTSSDGQAVLPSNYTFVAADAGVHTFSVTLKTAGTQSITSTDTVTTSITGSESGITVGAAAASSLRVTGFPSTDTAGVAHNVTVAAYDPYGNIATGYTGTVHFTSSDSQAVLPANYTFVAADTGVHTFSVMLKTAATQFITSTDMATSSITGSETGIAVGPAAASSLTATGFPSPDTAGVAHNVTVTAYDPYGNIVTGYTGTVHFNSSDRQAVLPANYTFVAADAGVHTFSVTLKTAATQSITSTDTATSSITGSESGVAVGAAAASSLTITGLPATVTAGTPNNVTVTAYDAYGNIGIGYRGTVHFTSSDSQASLPANYTYTASDAGAHTFSVTLNTSGSQSITATDTATSSITGSVNATVNSSGALVVSAGNNVSTGESATVTFAGSVTGGTAPYTYLWTFGDGSATSANTAGFVQMDTLTHGNWIGEYGAAGYNVIGNAASYPAYATITPSGQSSYTWVSSTTDVRALQKSANPTDRVAACWYSSSSFLVDVNLTDGRVHPFSIYALDWDTTSRSERIDVLDVSSGAVLDTRTISSFSGGEYLTWNISGHVQLKVTMLAGANAVISGLFIGNSLNSNIGTLTPSHIYTQHGAYTASLAVTDSAGRSGTSTVAATVADVAPTATVTVPAGGNLGIPVSFSASATSPSPVDQAAGFSYNWLFGDGTTGSGASPTHIYTSTGTYTVSVTATDIDGAASQPASAPIQITQRVTHVYYVAPNAASGSGTVTNPFGLPDLLTASFQIGPALANLQPGDTLEFRGGTYNFTVPYDSNRGSTPLMYPGNSGTAWQPITLQAYPGETPNLVLGGETGQALLGTLGPTRNYVRFLGLTVTITAIHDRGLPYGTNSPSAFRISGIGNEVGYCEITGATVTTSDIHSGIFVDGDSATTSGTWLHHNNIHGVVGASQNSTGILVYGGSGLLVEDNYIHDNTCEIFDKDGGHEGDGTHTSIYRRNYLPVDLSNQGHVSFRGAIQANLSTFYVYDNVMGGSIVVGAANEDSQIYNNLLTNLNNIPPYIGMSLGDGTQPLYRLNIWNNVVFSPASTFDAVFSYVTNYIQSGSTAPIAYMDYNVYTGTPSYAFANMTMNLPTMRGQGFENSTSVVASPTNIYQDLVSYNLLPQWATAGRYGDPVGPRFPISTILDASRYGPAALAITPTITSQPQNQTVGSGSSATFSVAVSGGTVLSYQWERSNDSGTTWLNLQGANSATFAIPSVAPSDNGAMFRCLVSLVGGSAESWPATLTVTAAPAAPTVAIEPANQAGTVDPIAPSGAVASSSLGAATAARKSAVQVVSALAAPDRENPGGSDALSHVMIAIGPLSSNTTLGMARSVVKMASRNSGATSIDRNVVGPKFTVAGSSPSKDGALPPQRSLFAPSRFGLRR
jgi:PKD repeat protein